MVNWLRRRKYFVIFVLIAVATVIVVIKCNKSIDEANKCRENIIPTEFHGEWLDLGKEWMVRISKKHVTFYQLDFGKWLPMDNINPTQNATICVRHWKTTRKRFGKNILIDFTNDKQRRLYLRLLYSYRETILEVYTYSYEKYDDWEGFEEHARFNMLRK